MSRWIGRFAVEVEFEAADPNEAQEIGRRIAENPPATWCGLTILGRTPYWFAEADDDDPPLQGDERE